MGWYHVLAPLCVHPGLLDLGFLLQVVLCTNVAETSLTVDDCCLVIDSGRQKSAECARATGDIGEM